MAAADTARLIASLELKDKFTGPSKKVLGSLTNLETGIGRIGNLAQQGARTAAGNIAKIGAAATVGIAAAVKIGLDNLAQLESAIASVDGAIEQMGLTGQITGKQIAGWANDIERDIGAAFDDKAITQAAATLVRFGKVTPKNLRAALEVVTDLAVKTGDVESASELLAKALADPAKAAGKLARQGIILTKAQQDQIKAMLEVNDVAGAQALILDEVAKTTKGAAAASQGPYARSLSILKDVSEDVTKALAVGFLPVITKVSDLLGKELAKPETLANIQKFGEGLASGLDDLIDVAKNLPWATIGESLKLGAAGATAILKAFTSLPPWIQTAVLTGWGLNKLTGGALGGIVAELGKGLVKGVLGINAGVVNINAATVNGGAPGTAPAGAGKANLLTTAAAAVTGAGVIITAEQIAIGVQRGFTEAIGGSPLDVEIAGKLPTGLNIGGPLDRLVRAFQGDFRSDLEIIQDLEREQLDTTSQKLDAAKAATQAFAASERAESRAQQNKIAAAAAATSAASREAGRISAQAIREKDLSVSVQNINNITTRVTVRETIESTTTHKQYARYLS